MTKRNKALLLLVACMVIFELFLWASLNGIEVSAFWTVNLAIIGVVTMATFIATLAALIVNWYDWDCK